MEHIKPGVKNFVSLVKFSHTLFAMPFALTGFVLALTITGDIFSVWLLLLVLLAMVTARNAAMGFNRFLDRDVDAKNPRTSKREIPAGVISAKGALVFVAINSLLFLLAAFFINDLAFILAFPTLAVLLGYSYMKRISALSHYVLGVALAIAPTGAFIAVSGSFHLAPVLLSVLVLFWVSGFDIIYSLEDEKFDKANKLHSVPCLFGIKNALRISWAGHIMVLPFLVLFYISVNNSDNLLGWIYIAGSLLFSAFLVWQHLIVSSKDLSRVNAAFFTSNGIASVVFATFTIADLLL
ncbi:MAG: putative 4-hydroxybenzoate polyprenyltransferase [Bacteroidales bacterium]|jgi:4-hydroxybenzoate polyprenyltransferase|nr:putative 4-hydroxybenzoate polyprenyltransferase [Bacteroidales bacterium]MDD3300072.1 putative 4-hydroxybenzoate polyprenyltransferase [Bacteroidales bacterium]MDD3843599.1 putative 4-hydroxybenzoate polyprenyltransferase [Bacteroidales bacterium]MDD4617720.1 putative 4-hydroxybenzoate polyprenyltransferase [Bacteroidales bacterium]